MIILGIDPGTAITGYGIIKIPASPAGGRNDLRCLNYGCIKTSPGPSAGERLKKINLELSGLIKKYAPNIIAVENIFFFKNLKTAVPVAQAKGVILLTAAKYGVPIHEFTPLQIKMTLTGYGKAEKKQVQKMVQKTLDLKDIPKPDDAADALAAAISCALSLGKRRP